MSRTAISSESNMASRIFVNSFLTNYKLKTFTVLKLSCGTLAEKHKHLRILIVVLAHRAKTIIRGLGMVR